nr:MAG TPA: hypothetical protein [Caudoviricetes sp.]
MSFFSTSKSQLYNIAKRSIINQIYFMQIVQHSIL